MATYTLSYTGAEVNSAIGNAKDLFSTVHTWTGAQTFQAPIIAGGTITGARFQSVTIFEDDVTLQGDVICTGSFICDGSATFNSTVAVSANTSINGNLAIASDLAVSGDARVDGELIARTIRVTRGLNMDGNDIDGADRIYAGSLNLRGGKAAIVFRAEAGTMPADGVYISTSGLTVAAYNDPHPANVVLIIFDY